jgi:hypothetical protein
LSERNQVQSWLWRWCNGLAYGGGHIRSLHSN